MEKELLVLPLTVAVPRRGMGAGTQGRSPRGLSMPPQGQQLYL